MKGVCLISLPWQEASKPSPAVGALAAFLRRSQGHIRVDCRNDHVGIARRIGPVWYGILTSGPLTKYAEMLAFPALYPEKAQACVGRVAREVESQLTDRRLSEDAFRAEAERQLRSMTPQERARAHGLLPTRSFDPKSATGLAEIVEMSIGLVMVRMDLSLEHTAREIADQYDLVGLTTSYNQLPASLSLCEKLKRLSPQTLTVLGGSPINGRVGPSLIAEYPFIDFIVQGEGEYPLNALVGHLDEGDFAAIETTAGILTRKNAARHEKGVAFWQVADLDALPFPDYDDYAELVGNGDWVLLLEGSRGCWWDQCRYCNLNNLWRGYRVKSAHRFAAEVAYLCKRYRKTTFEALDNVLNRREIQPLARALRDTHMDLWFFYELRANISPYELLALQEAGLVHAQVGIEGLSRSFLKRIRKGTQVIQNLQVMKTLYELGIGSGSNLIVDYPQSTEDEVRETCRTIRNYAYAYEPLGPKAYYHVPESPLDRERDHCPVKNIRNEDLYRHAIPDAVLARIELFRKSYDPVGTPVSWSPVLSAVQWWQRVQGHYAANGKRPMRYFDCQTLLIVEYLRLGKQCTRYLYDLERELYLYCTKIRSKRKILERFSRRMSEAELDDYLAQWTSECILYREGEKFLSLAPARDPRSAARRIREMAREEGEIH
ncbi:MAG: radical SAM protein [Candidatus Thiosymbion ectosymbiont of Robbea hypermnestra]|nr:radical SAM protein [Candidatus Thiosymbion ectosymbiont of Robbea hypermnestra]